MMMMIMVMMMIMMMMMIMVMIKVMMMMMMMMRMVMGSVVASGYPITNLIIMILMVVWKILNVVEIFRKYIFRLQTKSYYSESGSERYH